MPRNHCCYNKNRRRNDHHHHRFPGQSGRRAHPSANGGVLPHWKHGAPFAGDSDRTAPVYDPATGQVTTHVALASEADADAVIADADAAYPAWRDTSLARRTQVLFRFRELLNARKHEAAEIITSEHGKVMLRRAG